MFALISLILIFLQADTVSAAHPAVLSGPLTMAASTQKNILVVRIGGVDVKKYDVSVGTKKYPTPMGRFSVKHIVWNPKWVPPPDAKWAKGKQPTQPGDPKNPMKIVKIFFQEPDYYIHGTDKEEELGGPASHGCIRMAQADVYDLATFLMQHDGAAHDPFWYADVIQNVKTEDVHLPRGVPLVIGR
jgi:murein L,D-transpeptidase YcbB/YkuD